MPSREVKKFKLIYSHTVYRCYGSFMGCREEFVSEVEAIEHEKTCGFLQNVEIEEE